MGNVLTRSEAVRKFGNCNKIDASDLAEYAEIGEYALQEMTALTSIVLPSSIEHIGYSAFMYCRNLKQISVENPAQSMLSSIDGLAFYGCDSLTSISLPNSASKIDHYAFYYCGAKSVTVPGKELASLFPTEASSLTSVTFAAGAILQPYEFKGCTALSPENIVIGDISAIMPHAFDEYKDNVQTFNNWYVTKTNAAAQLKIGRGGSSGLTSIVGIAGGAAEDDANLTGVYIGSGVRSIGSRAFANCKKLTTLSIADDVSYISPDAFYGCTNLTSIYASQSMLSIGLKNVFPQTYQTIKSVTLANGVSRIYDDAFAGLDQLKSISFSRNSVTAIEPNAIPYAVQFNERYGSTGELTALSCCADWLMDGTNYTSENLSLTSDSPAISGLAPGAFADNSSVETACFTHVKYIGAGAFSNCSNIRTVQFDALDINSFQSQEFDSGLDMKKLSLLEYNNNSKKYIRLSEISELDSTLKTKLTTLICAPDCKKINDEALKDCTTLEYLDIGKGKTAIGNSAFSGCSGLKTIILNGESSIGSNAFKSCDNLSSCIFYDRSIEDLSVSTIGLNLNPMTVAEYDNGTARCVRAIKFANSLTTLSGALSCLSDGINVAVPTNQLDFDCNGQHFTVKDIKKLELQPTITCLSTYVFEGCSNLEELTIKIDDVSEMKLEDSLFRRCYRLRKIRFTGTENADINTVQALKGNDDEMHYPWGYSTVMADSVSYIITFGQQ